MCACVWPARGEKKARSSSLRWGINKRLKSGALGNSNRSMHFHTLGKPKTACDRIESLSNRGQSQSATAHNQPPDDLTLQRTDGKKDKQTRDVYG